MTNPVAVLRTERDVADRWRKVLHLGCPGCGGAHQVTVEKQEPGMAGPLWEWDGNVEAPTLSPSVLVRIPYADERGTQVCHSFLRGGRWEFLSDCTHALAGRTADMKPLPDWLVAEGLALTDVDRPAWVLWQIRALWRYVLDLERKLVDLARRVEQLEQPNDDAQEG